MQFTGFKKLFSKIVPGKNLPSIALFIDAENVSPKNVPHYMREVALHGNICNKEAFACGTLLDSKDWKNILLLHAIEPRQALRIIKGKNTSDIALTARVMQVYNKIKPGITFIISGDSDYSPLVQLLRQEKHNVIVIAKNNVSDSYVKSLSHVIFEETIEGVSTPLSQKKLPAKTTYKNKNAAVAAPSPVSRPARIASAGAKPASPVKVPLKTVDASLLDLAYKSTPKGKFDYPTASNFNITLKKLDTGFHYKNYGFKTFKDLLISLAPRFEMILNENKTLYIKKTA